MGFGEAINLFFKNYANFNGRSRRAEFWWPYLMIFIITLVLTVVMMSGLNSAQYSNDVPLSVMIGGGLLGIFVLAILIPQIAVSVRRLHDRNMTGWFYLVSFVPYVGGIILLVMMALPGTQGPNKYGPDPKNPTGIAEDVFS